MGVRQIGARVQRVEDENLIRGDGKYVDDIQLPGMAYAAFLRSSMAHAKIKIADISAAQALPGVYAVLTYDTLPSSLVSKTQLETYPAPIIKQSVCPDLLASEEVAHVGQAIAMVIASSRHIAEDACELIQVDYTALRVAVDVVEAAKPEGPLAHSQLKDNIAASIETKFGDVETAFSECDDTLKLSFKQHRGGCHAMECRGVLGDWQQQLGELTLYSSTQCPYLVRRMVSRQLDCPENSIRVIAPDVGGGFGPKAGYYPEEALIAIATKELHRPVKWTEDRREHFTATNQQRDQIWELEVGFKKTGEITAIKGHVTHDSGAFLNYGLLLSATTLMPLPGPYKIKNLHVTLNTVYTNTVSTSPVRGAGRPNAAYAMDRVIDAVARHLSIDPADMRHINLVKNEDFPYQPGSKHRNGSMMTYDSGDYTGMLAMVKEMADYDNFRQEQKQARANGKYLGIGLACFIEDTGMGPYEGVNVRVDVTGNVIASTGAASQGQGHATVIAQVIAEQLDIEISKIRVESGDTGKFPHGIGAIGSRTGVNVGLSANDASGQVKKKALKLASILLDKHEDALELSDGAVRVRSDSNQFITLADLALQLSPAVAGKLPDGFDSAGLEAVSYLSSDYMPHSSGANIAKVEVDIVTGGIKILDYYVVHDCGRILNPMIVDGQIIGGVVHGIGNAMFEQMVYDDAGNPMTTNYGDYLLPLASEMPEIHVAHIETPSPANPMGLKGAGEGGTIPAIGAMINAIEDALTPFDAYIAHYPVTPEYIVELVDSEKIAAE